jgi:hypothetical protein
LTRTPAQTFSHLIGWVLTLAGVIGFFYCASFSTGAHVPREDLFGILTVNGWHNLVHLLTGLIGLWASRSRSSARGFCYGLFVFYTALFVLGLAYGTNDAALGLIPVNTPDDVLHGLIAGFALISGLATPSVPAPTYAGDPGVR